MCQRKHDIFLFLIYLVHWGWVLPVGAAAPRTFAPGGKNPRAAADHLLFIGLLVVAIKTEKTRDCII